MGHSASFLSVGIDIGTTTTQLVISRLGVGYQGRMGQVPRLVVTDCEVVYQSPIVLTPFLDGEQVDGGKLVTWVGEWYEQAGVVPALIQTGAVIITGETAKKRNADLVLHHLAGMAGDFVVSIAGPHLESLLAGRGSGAEQYAHTHYTTIINIDIGGGTANLAAFSPTTPPHTAAMNVGGRLLEIEPTTAFLCRISAPAQAVLDYLGLPLKVGDQPTLEQLYQFTNCLADLIAELLLGQRSPLAQQLYLTEPIGKVPASSGKLMFSGGVGYYIYHPLLIQTVADLALHGDVGPLLAQSICQQPTLQRYQWLTPQQTSRATVIGAGTQTLTFSGSTIWLDPTQLPLRNVPILHLTNWELSPLEIGQSWDLDLYNDPFALVVALHPPVSYRQLAQLASRLAQWGQQLPLSQPFILLMESDYAQALGQLLKAKMPAHPLLILDQLPLAHSDYLDIGIPLPDQRTVPVTLKTLIFYPNLVIE